MAETHGFIVLLKPSHLEKAQALKMLGRRGNAV